MFTLYLMTVSWLGSLCQAHVSLKFPPARKYDLDFLDSFRTVGDCGMEAGDTRTSFQAGERINVTWHLGYPHGGGHRIELINGGQTTVLSPGDGAGDGFVVDKKETQSHLVELPQGLTCDKCYLRLVRQATEWGPKYLFRSCADISIVSEFTENCSGHGTWDGGACKCDRMFHGSRCQYMAGCDTDDDCNGPKGQGRCEGLDDVLYPDKQCMCAMGWFGDQCQKKGIFEDKNINLDGYQEQPMGINNKFYWRIDQGEIDIIVQAKTNSWVAVGWRPSSTTRSCKAFPADAPQPKDKTLHAMDCTDIVIGTARGGRGRVGDFYTRDRSTPREDTFWGGEDDLTSAAAWEQDGVTTMRFRKSTRGGDGDQPFGGKLNIIWATGQKANNFYKEDQLKYHGGNRGKYTLEFPSSSPSIYSSSITVFVAFISIYYFI